MIYIPVILMSIFQNVSHFLLHDPLHYYPFQRKIKGPSDFPSASRFPLVNMLIYLYYTLLWLYRWPQKTAVNAFFSPNSSDITYHKNKEVKKASLYFRNIFISTKNTNKTTPAKCTILQTSLTLHIKKPKTKSVYMISRLYAKHVKLYTTFVL